MSNPTAGDSTRRVESIDGLRGIASLGVVLYHYSEFFRVHAIPTSALGRMLLALLRYGHLGVEIFFVLSGYVIAMTGSRYVFTRPVAERFVLRRLVRLVPPYWAMIGVISGTYLLGRSLGAFREIRMTLGQVVAHLIYAQNILGYPVLDVAYWTLCLEVQFYLVFAVSAWILHRGNPRSTTLWFIGLTLGSIAIDLLDLGSSVYFPRYWYRFGMGVLAYRVVGSRAHSLTHAALTGACLGVGIVREEASFLAVAAVSVLLWCMTRFPNRFRDCPAFLARLGTISYSLYLVHGYGSNFLGALFRSGRFRTEAWGWTLVAFFSVSAVAFAALFHQFVERRAIEWSRRVRING